MFRLIYSHNQADCKNKKEYIHSCVEVLRYLTFTYILYTIYLKSLMQLRTFYYRHQPDGSYISAENCSWLHLINERRFGINYGNNYSCILNTTGMNHLKIHNLNYCKCLYTHV